MPAVFIIFAIIVLIGVPLFVGACIRFGRGERP